MGTRSGSSASPGAYGFRLDLEFVKANYPILDLVRELQEDAGMTRGMVRPEHDRDQKTRCVMNHAHGIEQTASAKAYVGSNSIYCFVCGRTWDVPGLYAAYHGVSVPSATATLLRRLGRAPASAESGSLADVLSGLGAALAPITDPPPPVLAAGPVRAWLDEIELFLHVHLLDCPAEQGYSDDPYHFVVDAVEAARAIVDASPTETMASVRRAIVYALDADPSLPPIPAERSDLLQLRRLPLTHEHPAV